MSIFLLVLAFFFGALSWSLSEYALHNWVFHGPRGKTFLSREHLAHHARTSYFSPTWVKVLLGFAVTMALAPLSVFAVGPGLGIAYVAGFVLGYTFYEVTHRRIHTHPPRGPYGRWARKSHLHHHFHSPHRNHGVTSPIWDIVFGTYERPDVVTVPRKQMMDWLRDPGSGVLRPEFADDYRLGKRRGVPSVGGLPADAT